MSSMWLVDTDSLVETRLFAEGLDICVGDAPRLIEQSTEYLEHVMHHLTQEFGSAAIVRGYVRGIAIILAERSDNDE